MENSIIRDSVQALKQKISDSKRVSKLNKLAASGMEQSSKGGVYMSFKREVEENEEDDETPAGDVAIDYDRERKHMPTEVPQQRPTRTKSYLFGAVPPSPNSNNTRP